MSYTKRAYDLIHTSLINKWADKIANYLCEPTSDDLKKIKKNLEDAPSEILYLEQHLAFSERIEETEILSNTVELFARRYEERGHFFHPLDFFSTNSVITFDLPRNIDDVIENTLAKAMDECKDFKELEERVERGCRW